MLMLLQLLLRTGLSRTTNKTTHILLFPFLFHRPSNFVPAFRDSPQEAHSPLAIARDTPDKQLYLLGDMHKIYSLA